MRARKLLESKLSLDMIMAKFEGTPLWEQVIEARYDSSLIGPVARWIAVTFPGVPNPEATAEDIGQMEIDSI